MRQTVDVLLRRLAKAKGGHKKVIEKKLLKLGWERPEEVVEVKKAKPRKKAAKKKTTKKKD